MRHRPEIDGLRTIAVIPVILFHAGLPGLGGGFTGVDVFFVISGYLITAILLADLASGRFSMRRFYERRARRILPALGLVLLACLPFAWAWMTPEQLEDFSQALVAVSLFASNLLFWLKTGYFETGADLNPLLHSWSLAVEEQFYLLFPPLLWLLWRIAPRRLGLALGLLGGASLALCLWLVTAAPSANFFLAPSRAWELMAGALCAVISTRSEAPPAPRLAPAAALAGLGLILAGIALIGAATPFPSLWTLLPVGGTVLVILFAGPGNACGRLLARRPLVAIGLVSYSAYLIHQPLMAFARIRSGVEPPLALMLGLALLSLPLAWLSWRHVEEPFRGRQPRLLRRQPVLLGCTGAVLACWVALGLVGTAAHGWRDRFPRIAALERDSAIDRTALPCQFTGGFDPQEARACLTADPGRTIVLLGDSHALAIRGAFSRQATGRGWRPVTFEHDGCFPIPGTTRLPPQEAGNLSCRRFVERVYDLLEDGDWPVILMTRWALNLEGSRFDNGEGGVERGAPVRVAVLDGAGAGAAALPDHVVRVLSGLAEDHPLLLIGPFPEAGWNVPQMVAGKLRRGEETPVLGTSAARYRTRNATALQLLDRLAARGVATLPLDGLFCGGPLPGRCVNYADGVSYYSDDDHPSPAAARIIARAALAALQRSAPAAALVPASLPRP